MSSCYQFGIDLSIIYVRFKDALGKGPAPAVLLADTILCTQGLMSGQLGAAISSPTATRCPTFPPLPVLSSASSSSFWEREYLLTTLPTQQASKYCLLYNSVNARPRISLEYIFSNSISYCNPMILNFLMRSWLAETHKRRSAVYDRQV